MFAYIVLNIRYVCFESSQLKICMLWVFPTLCILWEDQYKPCGCWVTSDRLIALLMQRILIFMKLMITLQMIAFLITLLKNLHHYEINDHITNDSICQTKLYLFNDDWGKFLGDAIWTEKTNIMLLIFQRSHFYIWYYTGTHSYIWYYMGTHFSALSSQTCSW